MSGRLEKLKELEKELYTLMKRANSRSIAAIAKQYRETLREIDELEGNVQDGDDIDKILSQRESSGKPGAVR